MFVSIFFGSVCWHKLHSGESHTTCTTVRDIQRFQGKVTQSIRNPFQIRDEKTCQFHHRHISAELNSSKSHITYSTAKGIKVEVRARPHSARKPIPDQWEDCQSHRFKKTSQPQLDRFSRPIAKGIKVEVRARPHSARKPISDQWEDCQFRQSHVIR